MNPATQSFRQEAAEILEDLGAALLELESNPSDTATIDAVFRALHTLKGSGAMFGFSSLAAFLHHFENAFDRIRSGEARVTPGLIEIALLCSDHVERLLSAGPDPEGGRPPDAETAELVARLEALEDAPVEAEAELVSSSPSEHFSIDFKPAPAALRHGMRPDLLLAELATLGETRISCSDADVPPLRDLDPTECHLAWRVEIETDAGRAAIDDVFLFASDAYLEIERHAAPGTGTAPAAPDAAKTSDALSGTAAVPDAAPARPEGTKSDSVRVQAHRLDDLMDQLGELVIAQARLNRIANDLGDISLSGVAEEVERLVTGLRDATLSIRMLPIELVFGKFRRVVRDLSNELGKLVRLETRGGETEVDKNVIDSLTEPLVHIIRNSIDHGVEAPADRVAAGKPEQARVLMQARQSGGEVLISVTDDGAGLDADAIRRRAVERGLISEDEETTDEQLHQLIFAPGFSTAKTLSSVSGRGVGMDAVRRVIDDLRGSVEVRSETGRGTQVTLRLPLTLAIIDGLLVKVAGGHFVMPLSAVEECVELPQDELERRSGRAILRIRDELVPFLDLDTLFGFAREETEDRRVVITSIEGRRTGLVVDEVIGQHQTVIKPLSVYHRGIEGLAGSTILGDGSVALILDAPAIVKLAGNLPRAAA